MGSPRRPRFDWERIRADYVEGFLRDDGQRTWPSMRELAAAHDVGAALLRRRAAAEDWTGKRETFRTHLDRERQSLRIRQLSEDAIDLDSRAIFLAKAGLQLVQRRVTEITRRAVKATEANEDAATGIDAHEASALALSGARWYQLGQLALGEPTERVEHTGAVEVEEPLDAELRRLVREAKEREEAELERERSRESVTADGVTITPDGVTMQEPEAPQ